jgi:hypothetical protein
LISDTQKGTLHEEIKNERVLSCIVEGKVKLEDLERALTLLKTASNEIDTVFSLGLVTRMEDGFRSPIEPVLNRMDLQTRPNAKINLGLGKPLCED